MGCPVLTLRDTTWGPHCIPMGPQRQAWRALDPRLVTLMTTHATAWPLGEATCHPWALSRANRTSIQDPRALRPLRVRTAALLPHFQALVGRTLRLVSGLLGETTASWASIEK